MIFAPLASIVQTLGPQYRKTVRIKDIVQKEHQFQKFARMELMQQTVKTLSPCSSTVFLAGLGSTVKVENLKTTIDALLGTSAQLEPLYLMIAVCYVQLVSIAMRGLSNQQSAGVAHSRQLVPRARKIAQIVI